MTIAEWSRLGWLTLEQVLLQKILMINGLACLKNYTLWNSLTLDILQTREDIDPLITSSVLFNDASEVFYACETQYNF